MRDLRRVLARIVLVLLAAFLVVETLQVYPTRGVAEAGAPPGSALAPDAERTAQRAEAPPAFGSVLAPEPEPRTITLAFAGDTHFERDLADVVDRAGSTVGPMSDDLRSADLAMLNLESALTRRGSPTEKELEDPSNRYWFRSPPATLAVLDRSGVDVVSMANNHAADYGVTGLRDAVRAGRDSPVGLVGIGLNRREAFRPFRATVKGTDVAVLAADASFRESADPIWGVSPGSGPGIAGARQPDAPQLLTAVRAAASVDDLVVVYLHWGDEGETRPSRRQTRLAAGLRQAGADIVVGSHSHTLLGAGTLGDTYVSYGLGNFRWYNGARSETGVLRLRVRGDEVVADQWRPGRIPQAGGAARPLVGAAARRAVSAWRASRRTTNLAPAGTPDDTAATGLPAYAADVSRIGPELRRRMNRTRDQSTCPVPLSGLRLLRLSYVGFDGAAHRGSLVVADEVADDVVTVFARLYRERFPIARMRLVDAYGGDDDRSMAADNTSAYNCRTVAGTSTFSDHASGRAIDINPVQNPYVLGDRVLPPAGRAYVDADRSSGARPRRGVIRDGDVVRRAFAAVGWTWGGDFTEPDYQHFAAP